MPTFDNARTLGGVIDGVLALGLPVLVVDDGATDDTAGVLAGFGDRIGVVRHAANRGKAAALRSGFVWAVDHHFTHAVTIDTDGQHDAADVPTLLTLVADHPAAIVLGVRDTTIAGYPALNRLGRWAANLLVRFEGGPRVADSQCGLRVYPLASVSQLQVRSGRYGFETEVLTRAAWAGVPTMQTPVRCVYDLAGGRITHFRKVVDTLGQVGLHARLLTLALLRWINPAAAWRAARQNPQERRRFAAAVAAGVFIGNLPLWGLHTVISVACAKRLRLQPLAVIGGSHVTTPPFGPVLVAAAIAIGHWVLHGKLAVPRDFNPAQHGFFKTLFRFALEWTIGGVICGATLGVMAYAIVYLLLRPSKPPSKRPSKQLCDTAERQAVRATASDAVHARGTHESRSAAPAPSASGRASI